MERYRKIGRTVRLEWSRGQEVVLRTTECGETEERAESFRSFPTPDLKRPEFYDDDRIIDFAREVRVAAGNDLVERMVVVSGKTEHWWSDGTSDRAWQEEVSRLHMQISSPHKAMRLTIDRGGAGSASLDEEEINGVVSAFATLRSQPATSLQGPLRLRPPVSAQIWSSLTRLDRLRMRPGVSMVQSTHPSFRHDGRGEHIARQSLFSSARGQRLQFPNVFRPSYRYPPVRAPFHIGLSGVEKVSPHPDPITAVACLSALEVTPEELDVVFLCRRPRERVGFAARLRIAPDELLDRITGEEHDRRWFPYEAGSYGVSTLIDDVTLQGL